ncbi:unnamed protein product, partial [Ascophyllum nodosum]
TGEVDLGQLATKHLGIGVGSRSLEDLTRSATLQGQCSYEQLGAGSICRSSPLCGSGCVCFGSALLFHHETRGSSIDVFLSGGA